MTLTTLKTHITNLVNKVAGATDYATNLLGFISGTGDVLQDLSDNKAPLAHTHDEYGEIVVTRGTEANRSSSTEITMHIRTDEPGTIELVQSGAAIADLEEQAVLAAEMYG
jgi:hypothetical protein